MNAAVSCLIIEDEIVVADLLDLMMDQLGVICDIATSCEDVSRRSTRINMTYSG